MELLIRLLFHFQLALEPVDHKDVDRESSVCRRYYKKKSALFASFNHFISVKVFVKNHCNESRCPATETHSSAVVCALHEFSPIHCRRPELEELCPHHRKLPLPHSYFNQRQSVCLWFAQNGPMPLWCRHICNDHLDVASFSMRLLLPLSVCHSWSAPAMEYLGNQ